jgi:hypothetical protein
MTSDRLQGELPGAAGVNGSGIRVMPTSLAAQWAALEEHFQYHAKLIERFREAGPDAVVRMWASQNTERGVRLSPFERDALIERHCELFGTQPDTPRNDGFAAELERADHRIAKGNKRVADQRRRVAELERVGRDIRLLKQVLLTLETSLQLMIECRGAQGRPSLGRPHRRHGSKYGGQNEKR